MRAIIQRVKKAKVFVKNKLVGQISQGFVVLLAVGENDKEADIDWLAKKIVNLRIMADKQNKMNKSLKAVNGEALVVSQFTLYGDCKKGNRPSFIKAANPKKGEKFYNLFIDKIKALGIKTSSGKFGAMMDIELVNNGPVTIIISNAVF